MIINDYSINRLSDRLNKYRGKKKIIMIGGSFDIIHVGHIRILEKAKKEGDILIVALNSDTHIKTYKPDIRPIVPETQRAEVISNIKSVDYVFITEDTDLGLYDPNIYKKIKPNVLIMIKEKDRYESRLKTAQTLQRSFPDLDVVFLEPIYTTTSTTKIIEKVLSKHSLQDKQ